VNFADVVGQERAIATLRAAAAHGRLHHALLFAGPEGIGKRTTALALAAFLLCKRPTADDSCGECPACIQVTSGTHADLYFLKLEVDEEGKSKKSVSIDQVRALQGSLARAALGGGRKVVIVDEAQGLTEPAQNAFLKTLEEPPSGSLIVLVARNASALTPTVRSRCQTVPFVPLADGDVERCLRERGRSAEDAKSLAAFAEGSLGVALDSDAAAIEEAEKRLAAILDSAASAGYSAAVQAAQDLIRNETVADVPLLLRVLRRRLRAAAGVAKAAELTRSGKTVSLTASLKAAEHAYRASMDIRRNANAALALERMWLEIGAALGTLPPYSPNRPGPAELTASSRLGE